MSSSTSRFFLLLFSAFIASQSLCFSEDDYKSPNFLTELAGIGELSEENEIIGDVIVKHLVGFAVNLEGDPETQSKALALAWHCNKKTRSVCPGFFYSKSKTWSSGPGQR